MTDEKILELFWNREESAITETAARYGKYCHVIAKNILFNDEDSEECVNDTWLNAWNAIPPHRPSVLRAFLGKLCRNLALNRYDYQRADKRGGGEMPLVLEELGDIVGQESEMEQMPDRIALTNCINGFLEKEEEMSRKVFVRRYWYMSSVKEIAEEYDFSESKVKMMLLRARKRLMIELEKEGIAV